MMEVLLCSVSLSGAVVVLVVYGWKFLNWVWFQPRKLEKCLRQLGFQGNSYRLFYGDITEMRKMMKEAKSKPIKISDDIVPRIIPFILKAVENYGGNCFIWLGPRPAVIVLDPESIREVLSKSYIFQKATSANRSPRLLSRGIGSLETDKWAKHRRLINPAFHFDKLKLMVPSLYLSCADMLSKWGKIVPSEGYCEVDVWPYLQTMTSDAISRTAFGSSYEEGRKIFQLQKEHAELLTEERRSVYIPGWRFLPTRNNRRIKEVAEEVESSVLGIIKKRMKTMESGEATTNNDLLGLLLESNFKEIKERGNKFGMSLNEVIEECKLFYFAGQETTAGLLMWTMILLSKHTDWQDRARDEVLQVLGSRKPEFQELNKLKIITMICHEVLRLYPPAAMLGRITVKDSSLGKTILPPGVQLILPAILLHHDPKLWGDDAKEFNPERFSEGIPKGQLSYFPFGWGPRICIAQNFAMLEAKMALAMILQHYSFELSPSYSHAPHTVITLQPQHGAHLIIRKL